MVAFNGICADGCHHPHFQSMSSVRMRRDHVHLGRAGNTGKKFLNGKLSTIQLKVHNLRNSTVRNISESNFLIDRIGVLVHEGGLKPNINHLNVPGSRLSYAGVILSHGQGHTLSAVAQIRSQIKTIPDARICASHQDRCTDLPNVGTIDERRRRIRSFSGLNIYDNSHIIVRCRNDGRSGHALDIEVEPFCASTTAASATGRKVDRLDNFFCVTIGTNQVQLISLSIFFQCLVNVVRICRRNTGLIDGQIIADFDSAEIVLCGRLNRLSISRQNTTLVDGQILADLNASKASGSCVRKLIRVFGIKRTIRINRHVAANLDASECISRRFRNNGIQSTIGIGFEIRTNFYATKPFRSSSTKPFCFGRNLAIFINRKIVSDDQTAKSFFGSFRKDVFVRSFLDGIQFALVNSSQQSVTLLSSRGGTGSYEPAVSIDFKTITDNDTAETPCGGCRKDIGLGRILPGLSALAITRQDLTSCARIFGLCDLGADIMSNLIYVNGNGLFSSLSSLNSPIPSFHNLRNPVFSHFRRCIHGILKSFVNREGTSSRLGNKSGLGINGMDFPVTNSLNGRRPGSRQISEFISLDCSRNSRISLVLSGPLQDE